MKVKLTQEQQVFVDGAVSFLKHETGFKTLQGKAGCGKTTSLAAVYEKIPELIWLVPTHKAGRVLYSKIKGIHPSEPNIITIASFLKKFRGTRLDLLDMKIQYTNDGGKLFELRQAREKLIRSGKAQQPVFEDKGKNDDENSIIAVCEEYSMVTTTDAEKIIDKCDSVVFVGDNFQIPAVVPIGDWRLEDFANQHQPDWRLTKVLRHDSGILHLANSIREATGRFDIDQAVAETRFPHEIKFAKKNKLLFRRASDPNVMFLSYTNYSVDKHSYQARLALDLDDKIITPNDLMYAASSAGDTCNKDEIRLVENVRLKGKPLTQAVVKNLENNKEETIVINTARLNSGLTEMQKRKALSERGLVLRFDYGRTIHASQGSEWDHVAFHSNIMSKVDDEMHNRLLYTTVTRAKKMFVRVEQ